MKQKKRKTTFLEVIDKILDSDLPLSTRNSVVRHYMLPQLGYTKAIIEDNTVDIGTVERPTSEELRIENNPRLKAEEEDTEKLMGGVDE